MIPSLLRESVGSARSRVVASTVTILMVAGMILAVMLTTGRTVGAEQQVLKSIDSVGTRAIVVRAELGAGITSDFLGRFSDIEGVEWAGGFSNATDATNALIADGSRVPVRFAYSHRLDALGIPPDFPGQENQAWASSYALELLGMGGIAGGITLTNGESYGLSGELTVPDFLADLEPLVLIPRPTNSTQEPVSVIVIIATRPDLVGPLGEVAISLLGSEDPAQVILETSEPFAQLRSVIEGQLGNFSRSLVLALLALTGGLVIIFQCSLVMMHRKDFGRRRALGASRSFVAGLIVVQTGLLALLGIALGTIVSAGVLFVAGDPWPGFQFTVALGVLSLVTTLVAALTPATLASRREPVRELRTP